ncbi:MAG: hypothetical protein ABI045_07015 [Flavobacteriales bacterium]
MLTTEFLKKLPEIYQALTIDAEFVLQFDSVEQYIQEIVFSHLVFLQSFTE